MHGHDNAAWLGRGGPDQAQSASFRRRATANGPPGSPEPRSSFSLVLADIFDDNRWLMRPSERAAIKGILAELVPELAIEIGTAAGGSLRRIAAQSQHVHAFDMVAPAPELALLPNVTFHIGDSHELLPRVLGELSKQGVNVDFVLVDGDHSAKGVRRDTEDLLSSPAVARTLILLHDTANPDVRAGLNAINCAEWPKLTWVDLDWLPGYVSREDSTLGQAWAGLGLMVADAKAGPLAGPAQIAAYAYPITELLGGSLAARRERDHDRRELQMLRTRVEELEQLQARMVSSKSWRLTGPLRALKGASGK